MPAGHKRAFASLRVLPVAAQGQDAPSKGAAAEPTLLWQGRTMTVGRSGAATLSVSAPLASRCSVVLRSVASGAVWLTDCSRLGTLLLEVPSGSTLGNSVTAAQLDALPWEAAHMLDHSGSTQLTAGCATLVVIGLHRQDWLAGAREGMATELGAKGAALLVYEQQQRGPPRSGAADAGEEPAALEQPAELAAALQRLPFARTPGSAAAAGKQQEQRHRSRRPTKEQPLGQAFNFHQWAAAIQSKPAKNPEPAKKVQKRVHFEREQEEGAEGAAGKPAHGSTARQEAAAVAEENGVRGAPALATHARKRRQGSKAAKLPNQPEGTKQLAAKPPKSTGTKRVAASTEAGKEEEAPEASASAPHAVKRQRASKPAAIKAAKRPNKQQGAQAAKGEPQAGAAKAGEAAAGGVNSAAGAPGAGGTAAAGPGAAKHGLGSKGGRAASALETAYTDASKVQAVPAAPGCEGNKGPAAPVAAVAAEAAVKLRSRSKFGSSKAAGLPKQQEGAEAANGKPAAHTSTEAAAAAEVLVERWQAPATAAAAKECRLPTAAAKGGGVKLVGKVTSAGGKTAKKPKQRGVRGMLGKPTRKQQLLVGAGAGQEQ